MRSRRVLACVVAAAALAPVGCSTNEPRAGEGRLEVNGQAIVDRESGAREVIGGKTDLGPGDRVELKDGVGTIALRDGVQLELRAGLGDAPDSLVTMATTPVLEAGDLLVTAPEQSTISVAGSTLVVANGAAHVARSLGMVVAAYEGAVHLDSAGIEREVPALREMHVPALGRPPRLPRPLDYNASDPWDRRFLGAAIDLGRTLESLANGYTLNLNRGEGRTPGFFRIVLPGLRDEPQFGASLIDLAMPSGETLIGAAITHLGSRGDFVQRWHSVFGFRTEGAEWGLVALDQAVSRTPLLGSIERAVGTSPLIFAAPVPEGDGQSTPPSGPRPPAPTPTTVPPTTPPTSPPPTQPLPDNPVTPVLEPVLEIVGDTASGLVSGLLGVLGGSGGG
ncbi:MAG: hypothetical protein WD691_01050 [Acidimicrobiales bacterium]